MGARRHGLDRLAEGFVCSGTEGCPNDYRAWFGEPGAVLPEGVEYYDSTVHTWVFPGQ